LLHEPQIIEFDGALNDHLTATYSDDDVRELASHFRRYGYVKLPGLVRGELWDTVEGEVRRLLDAHARRIDIHLKETGHSPRYMSTVSQQAIQRDGRVIPAVYSSSVLTRFLGRLAGEEIHPCPWDEEKYVIIRQEKPGDTHGWHWGDFSFTLIWLIEVPPPEVGGSLQCVPHTHWDKQDPRVEEWLSEREIDTWPHVSGDLYFLRSDTTLHRTIPLTEPATRIILNTCWASYSDTLKSKTHETMEAMFE
jgi:hypothetical protein